MLEMSLYGALILLYLVNIPFTIANVNKPRNPITVTTANIIVLIDIAFVAAFIYLMVDGR